MSPICISRLAKLKFVKAFRTMDQTPHSRKMANQLQIANRHPPHPYQDPTNDSVLIGSW